MLDKILTILAVSVAICMLMDAVRANRALRNKRTERTIAMGRRG